jgi:hypothetical protein
MSSTTGAGEDYGPEQKEHQHHERPEVAHEDEREHHQRVNAGAAGSF